ncbi:MAG: LacI family DNA-binding transcriptional regulator, partial [Bacteroidota bacterium]
MNPKTVTIKTIAQEFGVTPATVSKALRDSSDIASVTKEKIKKLAKELGYQPNYFARSLVSKHSNLLGVIVPDLNISYYSSLVQGIYENAQTKGYEPIILFHHEDPAKERKNLKFLNSLQVDGILINAANGNRNYDIISQIQNSGTPIVCYDRRFKGVNLSSVTIDDEEATEKLFKYLVQNDRKKIGYIGITEGDDVTVTRYESYRKCLQKYNMEFDPGLVVSCFPNIQDSEGCTKKALQDGMEIDAIICAGGFIAYGAGRAILSTGLKMPEDILLGEFGDNNIIQRLGVSYVSINESPHKMANVAVDLIDSYLKKNVSKEIRHINVDSKLIYYDH